MNKREFFLKVCAEKTVVSFNKAKTYTNQVFEFADNEYPEDKKAMCFPEDGQPCIVETKQSKYCAKREPVRIFPVEEDK